MSTARSNLRRLLALCVLAWLNLALQPCLALPMSASAGNMPTVGEHCAHHGMAPTAASDESHSAGHDMPCPEMQASNCLPPADLNAELVRSFDPPRTAVLVAVLPLAIELTPRALAPPNADARAGRSLTLRYGHFRN